MGTITQCMKLSSVVLLVYCLNAVGAPISFSGARIDWSSLTFSLDPGMTLNWVAYADPAQETADYSLIRSNKVGDNAIKSQIAGWTPTIATQSIGAFEAGGISTNIFLTGYSKIDESYIAQSSFDVIELYGGSARWGVFEIQGNGTISVSVDYEISIELQNSPSFNYMSGWALADLQLGQYIPSPTGGGGLWIAPYSEDEIGYSKEEPGSLHDNGTLSVSYLFSDGQIGRLGMGANGKLWAVEVPEPTAMILFSIGLGIFAIPAWRRKL